MHTFLSKLSQLHAIQSVMLLSRQGELLYCRQAQASVMVDKSASLWKAIIGQLNSPQNADLLFSKGRYYLHSTEVGFLIVGMSHDRSLQKIRIACANVQEKLVEPEVRKKVLLKMLSESEERLKPHLVNALIPFADEEVAQALLPFLQKGEEFHPQIKDKFMLALCRAFGHCAIPAAVQPLKKVILTYYSSNSNDAGEIKAAARQAVQKLEVAQGRRITAPTGRKQPDVRSQTEESPIVSGHAGSSPEEQRIQELIGSGEKRQAIALIMQLITNSASNKNFHKAEQLREWLMRIDATALVESIRAAEIIEEEKRAAIGNDSLEVWKELLETVSPDEFSALYHGMTQRNYAEGEIVARQGEFLSTLFFVNSGRVQIYAVSNGREVPLKIVGPGEVMGGETFFDVSVWTVNAVSMGAHISLLTMAKLQSQMDSFPALYGKVQGFCSRFSSPVSLFTKSGRTRRKFERQKVAGRVAIDLLDPQGGETGLRAKGDLLDLSKGGVSFNLRFSKKKNANALFGQRIRMNIRGDASGSPLVCSGKIMAVRCHDFIGNDYSLHVQFDDELSGLELQQVAGKGR